MSQTLPRPDFVARDPAAITAEMIAAFEEALSKTLYPSQVERILLDQIAYRETVLRIAIQETGLQNLAQYARRENLDHLGLLTGAARSTAVAALTEVRITRISAGESTLVAPAGTRVQSADGAITFLTRSDAVLEPARGSVVVWAEASEGGSALNGIAPGQLNCLPDYSPSLVTAVNITPSVSGGDAENDDHYRQRVMLSPEREACGTFAAYRLAALSCHPDILDVAVTSEAPGRVTVSAATATGSPDESLLAKLRTDLNHEAFRPLTDMVTVIAPERVPYTIALDLVLAAGTGDAPRGAVLKALETYAALLRKTLGRDLTPSRFSYLAQSVEGVQGVTLKSPTARVLTAHQWADCESITVTVTGISDD